MSGKRKDYKKVLKAIKLMCGTVRVEKVVLDFERAVWQAIPLVLHNVRVMRCAFHWTQCLWRKVQELGHSPSYTNDYPTHKLLRQFLALPYLPSYHIPAIFSFLSQKGQPHPTWQSLHTTSGRLGSRDRFGRRGLGPSSWKP
ncbi:uncharacterized protein LOC143022322 [Oratosquilla oratoria]|uniref:uncharacterized protein LOC143022322 n=1 Tax=Oratosquilla oratoria TaxID=337810 RepID=UPI003F75E3E4